MKKKLFALTMPVGGAVYFIYVCINRFWMELPDWAAYPMLVVSCVLMLVGVAYHGYCFGKGKNPYQF